MMENTALNHVPVGTVFQLDGVPLHFSVMFLPFLTGSFLIVVQEEEDPFPGSSFSRFDSPEYSLLLDLM
jgi:hypothetical protein